MRFEKVLVTGGSGLLGRFVVDELGRHAQVSVLDLAPPHGAVRYIAGSILDRAAVARAVSGQDAVIHLAALDEAVTAPEHRFFETNVQGLWNVLDLAEVAGVKRAVVCSSISAVALGRHNPPRYLPVDTDHPGAPTHAYGLSKQVGELVAKAFAARGRMTVCALRPTWVMQADFAYDAALKTVALDGGTPPPKAMHPSWRATEEEILGSRAFVSPADAARCFRAALEADTGPYDVFYVSAADSFTALPTRELVRREFGVEPEIRNPALYDADPRASVYDIGRTRKALGWEPQDRWCDLLIRVLAMADPRTA
ncbi:MAG: NAD(P)-dependent oxidoreductase [Dongiaceae bacterium]